MTLDDLIETLQALRARYPAAGAAYVNCPYWVDLVDLHYVYGEVQLGGAVLAFTEEEPEDHDDEAAVDPGPAPAVRTSSGPPVVRHARPKMYLVVPGSEPRPSETSER